MFASDLPPVVAPQAAADQQDVIEVVGTRSNQAVKIDRRTYRVQQNPHTAQKDAIQLLRGLPAVTITPDDQILLLGATNARIFIDGRPYSGNSKQYLQTLHGSDIERIEVITNPSAQYSAEGTAGIINLVLRKKASDGVSGNGSAEASSFGRISADSTVKYKHGKWAYEFAAAGGVGAGSRSTYHKRRSVEPAPGAPATVNTEDGGGYYKGVDGNLSGKVSRDLDSRTSISAKLIGGGGHDWSVNNAQFRGLTPDFESFSERRRLNSVASYAIGEFNFDHKGKREGETLSASAQFYGNPKVHDTTDARFSDASSFSIDRRNRTFFSHTQTDWAHPLGKSQILSLGGSWDIAESSQHYRFTSSENDGSLGPDTLDQYEARNSTLAAYATFQQSIGSWTVMPGLRIEQSGRHISTPGLPDVRTNRTNAFPTFHLEHPLSKTLGLTISYSKRIDRVSVDDLRPYRTVLDSLTIFQGNPRLKDQSTDAYEINLHYRAGKVDAAAILYDRETSRLWSKSYSVNSAGVSVYTVLNSGHSRDSGVQLDLSTPVLRRVKANVSINLFDQRLPVDTGAGRQSQHSFRYMTSGSLEWDGADRGKVPGDVAQLQWTYNGPSSDFQFHNFAWNDLKLSYTHSISRKLSLSGTFHYAAPNRHDLLAPLVQEIYADHRRPEFKLKLMKTFGNP